jgi:hypothetical protein
MVPAARHPSLPLGEGCSAPILSRPPAALPCAPPSPAARTGEASILRISAQLLQFANHISVAKRSLLQAHIRQFAQGAGGAGGAAGGYGGYGGDGDGGSGTVWDIDNVEHLPVESFKLARKKSQQRVRLGAKRTAAAPTTAAPGSNAADGDSGGGAGGLGSGAVAGSPVFALHTLDDIEYGMTYSRVVGGTEVGD